MMRGSLFGAFALLCTGALAQQTIDGTADYQYSAPIVCQNVQTGFGDNLSELDVAYSYIKDGVLYLTLAGNLENNSNKLNIFIDSVSGAGQNQLRGDNWKDLVNSSWYLTRLGNSGGFNGLKFEAGFAADHYFGVNRNGGNLYIDYSPTPDTANNIGFFLGQSNLTDGTLSGGTNLYGVKANYNGSNTVGTGGGSATGYALGGTVKTGLEMAIPLAAVGNPSGTIRICAFVGNSDNSFLSNQFLPGVGYNGGTVSSYGEPRGIDLGSGGSNTGVQYFVAPYRGNGGIVVSRIGGNSNSAFASYLEEWSTDATPVLQNTVNLPISTPPPNRLAIRSSTLIEGQPQLSADGLRLAMGGYDTGNNSAVSASTARVLGLIDKQRSIDTVSSNVAVYSGANLRGVYSFDGSKNWTADNSNLRYFPYNGTPVNVTTDNGRNVTAFNNQLFVVKQTGINLVGPGMPEVTTGTTSTAILSGLTEGYDVWFASATTMYVADITQGIRQCDYTGGTWTITGNALTDGISAPVGARSVTGTYDSSGRVVLYVVLSDGRVFEIVDTGTNTNTARLLAPAPTAPNVYRGVELSPFAANTAPTLTVPANAAINEGDNYSANATATDPDAGQTLTYSKIAGPSALTVSSGGAIAWTPGESDGGGVYTVTIKVEDNGSPVASDTKSFTITVNETNQNPVLNNPGTQSASEGSGFSVQLTGSDADLPVQGLTYGLVTGPSGLTVSGSGLVEWTPGESDGGTSPSVTVSLSDGQATVQQTFTINVAETNENPVLADPADHSVNEGVLDSVTLMGSDNDSPTQTLTYSLVSGPGSILGDTWSWTPDESNGGNTYTVVVKVEDDFSPPGSATQSFDVTVNAINDAPSFTPGSTVTVNEDSPAYHDSWATNISAGPPSESSQVVDFVIDSNDHPEYFSVQPSIGIDGFVSFTPAPDAFGTAHIVCHLHDDGGTNFGGDDSSDTVEFDIVINPVNDEPSFVVGADQVVDEDSGSHSVPGWATSISPGPANESGQNTFFVVTSNDNVSLFSAGPSVAVDGTLSFTPAPNQHGIAHVEVMIQDDGGTNFGGDDTSTAFSFAIQIDSVNDAPIWTTFTSNDATENSPFTFDVSGEASDPNDVPADSLSFSLVAGPAGLTVSPEGVVSWTPSETDGGSSPTVTVRVTDGGMPSESADTTFNIPVLEDNQNPVLGQPADQDVVEGQHMVVNLAATDDDDPTQSLAYSLVSTTATGLTVSPTGVVDWTPGEADGGTSPTVTVMVEDDWLPNHGSDTKTFTINVHEVNQGPVLGGVFNRFGVEGTLIHFRAIATDLDQPSNDPMQFTLGGAVPVGAAIDSITGSFSWTPTTAQVGSHTFNVIVTDSGSPAMSATQSVTIVVAKAGPLFSWGANWNNVVSDTPLGDFVQVSAGRYFSLAMRSDGTLAGWGSNGAGEVSGVPAGTFTSVSAGWNYGLALRPDGTIAAWGSNSNAQVSSVPSGTFIAVAAGYFHGVAIRTDGTLVSWGWNGGGQVSGTPTGTFTAVAAGYAHSVAIRSDGTLVSWGSNSSLQVSNTPSGTFTAVAAGADHSVAVRSDGSLASWGFDGNNEVTNTPSGTFYLAAGGGSHSIGLRTDQSLVAWGYNGTLFTNGAPAATCSGVSTGAEHLVAIIDNLAPAATPQSVETDEDQAVAVTLAGTDGDVPPQTLTFSVVSAPLHGSLSGVAPNLTYTPTSNYNGPDSFTFRAYDGLSYSAPATVSILVHSANDAPAWATIPGQSATEGTAFNLDVSASASDSNDVPANMLSFSLMSGPSGLTVSPSGLVSWTPGESDGGTSPSVTVRVTDNGVPSLFADTTFIISVAEVNQNPVLDDPADRSVNEGDLVSVPLSASDADLPAQTLTYSLVSGPGAVVGNTWSWTPGESDGGNSFTVVVKVEDNFSPVGSATQSFEVNVTEVNVAPVLAAIGAKSVDELHLLTFTATATDADVPAQTLHFSLAGDVPAGASITDGGVFTWTPTEAQGPGVYTFDVVVRDYLGLVDGGQDSETITVTVNEVNASPIINFIPNQSGTTNNLITFTTGASDVDIPANTLTFSLDLGAPAGASITSGGVFTWTPTNAQTGDFPVTVRVTDNGSPALSDAITINIHVDASNTAPVADDQSVSTPKNTPKAITLTATDNDVPAQTLSYTLIDAPDHGYVTFTGSPQYVTYWPNVNYVGPDSFTFKANDGLVDSNVATITIDVTQTPSMVISVFGSPAPNAFGSPSWPQYITNALTALESGASSVGDRNTDPSAYVQVTNAPWSDAVVGGFSCWRGVAGALPPFDQEGGNRLHFGLRIQGNGTRFTLQDLEFAVHSDDPADDLEFVGDFIGANYSATRKGIDYGPDRVKGTLDDITYTTGGGSSYVDEIIYVGVGNAWDATFEAGTDQEKLEAVRCYLENLAPIHVLAEYKIKDGSGGYFATGSTVVTIIPTNSLPVANDQTVGVNEDSFVGITLTATDADNETLAYTVLDGPTHGVLSGTAPNLTYTPFPNYFGSDSFTFKATDCVGDSNIATVTINVANMNDDPTLGAIGDKSVDELVNLTFNLSSSDIDGGAPVYSMIGGPVGATLIGNTFSWTPTEAQGPNVYSVTFEVSDGAGGVDSETISITVNEVNVAPVLGAIGTQTVNELQTLAFTATATDADLPANGLTYSLEGAVPPGASITAGGAFTFTPTEAQGPGSFTFDVVVKDNGAPQKEDRETITVNVHEVNVAPVLGAIGNKSVDELSLLTFTATATDSDDPANTLTFSLDAGAPAGASITSGGVFTWTPTEAQGPGVYSITVRVTDNGSPVLDDFETIQVTVNEVPNAVSMVLNLSLQDGFSAGGTVIRGMEIRVGGSGGVNPALILDRDVTFDATGHATITLTDADGLAAGDGYTFVSVKDPLHTIRRKVALNEPTADTYDATLALMSGNMNKDNKIDIGDYVVLALRYGTAVVPDTPFDIPGNPPVHTPTFRHADLNGDGDVAIDDYAILSANFGTVGDFDVDGWGRENNEIRRKISVLDAILEAGTSDVVKFDKDADGWITFDELGFHP